MMVTNKKITTTPFHFLQGGGELGQLIRSYDWSTTSIGTPDTWPQSLRTTLSILLASRFPMFLWWGDDLIQFYNDAYRPSLGNNGKHPKAVGQKGEECWPEIWPIIKPLIDQVLTTGEATWSEDQLIPIYRNGTIENVYWTFSYSPVKDEDGNIKGVLVICTETTEKIRNMQKLSESEQSFRNMVMQAPMGITVLTGERFVVEMANEQYLQLVDKQEETFVGKPLFEVLPEVKDFVAPLLAEVLQTGKPYYGIEFEVPLNRHGKIERTYFNFVYHPIRNHSGHIDSIMVVATEVTQQVVARHALQESERAFRSMVTRSPVAMTIFRGSDLIIEMANDALLQNLWQMEWEQVHGKKLLDVFPELRDQQYAQLLQQVLHTGIAYKENEAVAYVNTGNEGMKKFYLDFEYAPLLDPGNSVSGIMVTVYDVTEKVEARNSILEAGKKYSMLLEQTVQERTADLKKANYDLQRTNAELEQFAYAASHDLQEPLRKIRTFTELLERSLGNISAQSKTFLEKIVTSSSRMTSLIKDVLNYSQLLKTGDEFELVDLNKVLHNVLNDFELLIEEKSVVITIDTLPIIEANPLQLNQLFYNLINNSLKFSEPGRRPEISVTHTTLTKDEVSRIDGLQPELSYCSISFRDNGIGFDQQYAEQIFTIFQRLHTRQAYTGTGIGLALCKKIILNHHGSIRATSEPGKGATFSVLLPLRQS